MIPKPTGWTLDTYAAHNEALRAAEEKFQQERDRRYEERNIANRDAVRAALASSERASEKTEAALREYKVANNEWRTTVTDLTVNMPTLRDVRTLEEKIALLRETQASDAGKDRGISTSWGVLLGVIGLIATLLTIGAVLVTLVVFLNREQPRASIYTPAPDGTQLPSDPPTSVPR